MKRLGAGKEHTIHRPRLIAGAVEETIQRNHGGKLRGAAQRSRISAPTLSRLRRGTARAVRSGTLGKLRTWVLPKRRDDLEEAFQSPEATLVELVSALGDLELTAQPPTDEERHAGIITDPGVRLCDHAAHMEFVALMARFREAGQSEKSERLLEQLRSKLLRGDDPKRDADRTWLDLWVAGVIARSLAPLRGRNWRRMGPRQLARFVERALRSELDLPDFVPEVCHEEMRVDEVHPGERAVIRMMRVVRDCDSQVVRDAGGAKRVEPRDRPAVGEYFEYVDADGARRGAVRLAFVDRESTVPSEDWGGIVSVRALGLPYDASAGAWIREPWLPPRMDQG
jgi:hypothetical protein